MSTVCDKPSWLQMPFLVLASFVESWEKLKNLPPPPKARFNRRARKDGEVYQKLKAARENARESAKKWLRGDRGGLSPRLVKIDPEEAVFALIALWEGSLALKELGGEDAKSEWLLTLPPGVAGLLANIETHISA